MDNIIPVLQDASIHLIFYKCLGFSCSIPISDDFNRVILSMRRGQEFTDYINATFIDVSRFYSFLIESGQILLLVRVFDVYFWFDSGLQAEGLLHCHPGPSLPHCRGFLENGVGMEMSLYCHAHRGPGEGAGKLWWLLTAGKLWALISTTVLSVTKLV